MQRLHLEGLAASVKQELRTESLGQLRDVTAFFVQQLKSNRIAHAEVQTMAAAAPPLRSEAAVQSDAEPAAAAVVSGHTASEGGPREAVTPHFPGQPLLQQQGGGGVSARAVGLGTSMAASVVTSVGAYSEDFNDSIAESADITGW